MAKHIYFEPTDEVFNKFENYEISPCLIVGVAESGELIYEACDDDSPEIAIWCVYGHLQSGGLECISDHITYNDAKEFMMTLPAMHHEPLFPF